MQMVGHAQMDGLHLDREAGAATARCGGIRIFDLKGRTDEIVDEINNASAHIFDGNRINQNDGAFLFDHEIIRCSVAGKVESILKAGATAAFDGNAQHATVRFCGNDLVNPLCSAVAQGNCCFAHVDLSGKQISHGQFGMFLMNIGLSLPLSIGQVLALR